MPENAGATKPSKMGLHISTQVQPTCKIQATLHQRSLKRLMMKIIMKMIMKKNNNLKMKMNLTKDVLSIYM